MWGAIAVTVFVLVVVAVFRLDPHIAGYAAGALILVCLLTCVAAFSMGSRSERATTRLTDRIRNQSRH
jgi:hypothetical protein